MMVTMEGYWEVWDVLWDFGMIFGVSEDPLWARYFGSLLRVWLGASNLVLLAGFALAQL